MLFSSTFHGSWFLSALIISMCIIYFFHKIRLCWFIFPLSIFCYGFLKTWYFDDFYEIFQELFRPQLHLTFICGLIWVGFGYYLGRFEKYYKDWNIYVVLFLYSFLYMIHTKYNVTFLELFHIPLLFVFFHNISLKPKPQYRLLRNSSIIIFIIHFMFVIGFREFFNYPLLQQGFLYFIIVFVLSFLFAYIFIRISSFKYFKWLKMGY